MPDLAHVRDQIIAQTYREVLPGKFASRQADAMLLVIGLQESRFLHRKQIGGPATSFWQFERGGGVAGVLRFSTTAKHAQAVCVIRGVAGTSQAVHSAMLTDDLLGCAFARMLLYTDHRPLPKIGDVSGAWDYYIRNWRPGKPHRQTWDALYAQALEALG